MLADFSILFRAASIDFDDYAPSVLLSRLQGWFRRGDMIIFTIYCVYLFARIYKARFRCFISSYTLPSEARRDARYGNANFEQVFSNSTDAY